MTRFHKGDLVVLTDEGQRQISRGPLAGVVAAEPRDPSYIAVRREGHKSTQHWSADFWRPMTNPLERLLVAD